ncbi:MULTISPECIES: acetyl/propionyl/methylcrotonyl-CoA carboxylase subunit alpha [Sphingobium]|uniref:acetyl/propionyl/methylcrotonyl-CoA carboxylase subunit alpha n=1 Tax=Sphingobium sp. MI1205 TaxID=407020 RepID=UPI0007706925|nr:acetyl/propionyl/methylcrotonyl-CoA carboxylase subunit alpha [Sphingobium sp. MI1205]AMK17505.1 methylcrotonoyl-CoA carboxylase [Sphingobium sp. MI1205]
MIGSLLIANRGEVACRIIRTARRLGIRTVAVYSDADAGALHVREADEAIHIGPSAPKESYLAGDRIIEAARSATAEAIHPGYGFLSENAIFAQSVIDAGLIWVGPSPASIAAMGMKDAAKRLMADAGVPVTPGYLGEDQSPARLKAEADAIGYPVLIKAVAGGGGKGMRRVEKGRDFAEALMSGRREAQSSFGDDRVLIEKYILSPRHIEVQLFGDSHGNIVHLFERDCSLQRRHQKVIEEAPAPGMDDATREAICGTAVRAARAVDYVGAGTVEFIADASEGLRADRIWFMEMNTRLQVEHPVTEEITGIDLVEWQLRVASGERLPRKQEELSINGHAIEARLYAEDPARDFLPSTGRLEIFSIRADESDRIEQAVVQGDVVSPFYDPMIAKLICHAADRDEAIDRLRSFCASVEIWPVKTNAGFLARLLNEDFRKGWTDTGYIAQHLDQLAIKPPLQGLNGAASLLVSPWVDRVPPGLRGVRLNADRQIQVRMTVDGQPESVEFDLDGDTGDRVNSRSLGDGRIVLHQNGESYLVALAEVRAAANGPASDGIIRSPMPGRVSAVDVEQGTLVIKGQRLIAVEAMKMEHGLSASFDGVVTELAVTEGAQVSEGAILLRIEPKDG